MKYFIALTLLFLSSASCAEQSEEVLCSPSPELTCPAQCASHSGYAYDPAKKCMLRSEPRAVTCRPPTSTVSTGQVGFCLVRGDLILVGSANGIDEAAIEMESCNSDLLEETNSADFCE